MCFSSKKIEVQQPAAAAATPPPSPVRSDPVPAEESASTMAAERRKRAAAMKYGMASTIKTSGQGDTSAVNLLLPAVLGAGQKEKLGA